MERTLIIVKPDAVQRGLTGEIIRRFETRGLRIAGMKFMQVSRALAQSLLSSQSATHAPWGHGP